MLLGGLEADRGASIREEAIREEAESDLLAVWKSRAQAPTGDGGSTHKFGGPESPADPRSSGKYKKSWNTTSSLCQSQPS